ncbi:hypothetical protein AVEN_195900-1 [Araneus ventricosus]|uniref:Uncharacterized protein n=1 Tax=Araneus ventricosus TaxID=182803 RepID=A0A4Y2DU13_ARAVE|nr:hypothetical protein AVEN_195900-1 [Araneus ventricosus]
MPLKRHVWIILSEFGAQHYYQDMPREFTRGASITITQPNSQPNQGYQNRPLKARLVARVLAKRSSIVRDFLNRELPHRWRGRAGLDDIPLLPWPLRSPDLTPCDFFLWGHVKDKVYVSANNAASTGGTHHCCCDGHRQKHATERLDGTGLSVGCVPVTKDAHIEHL